MLPYLSLSVALLQEKRKNSKKQRRSVACYRGRASRGRVTAVLRKSWGRNVSLSVPVNFHPRDAIYNEAVEMQARHFTFSARTKLIRELFRRDRSLGYTLYLPALVRYPGLSLVRRDCVFVCAIPCRYDVGIYEAPKVLTWLCAFRHHPRQPQDHPIIHVTRPYACLHVIETAIAACTLHWCICNDNEFFIRHSVRIVIYFQHSENRPNLSRKNLRRQISRARLDRV